MRRIYLASPYSHPSPCVRINRWNAVCRAAGELMNAGTIVFSPIAHSHPISVQCDLPLGWDFWSAFDRAYIEWCDALMVLQLPGWKESVGVRAEIEIARDVGKPVEFMEPAKTDEVAA